MPVAKWGTDLVGEEERPEVVAYFDRNYPSTGDAFAGRTMRKPIRASDDPSPSTPASSGRAAGGEHTKLSEDLNRLSLIRARLNLRLDFAWTRSRAKKPLAAR